MEPVTAGIIALLTLLLDKTLDKTGDVAVEAAFKKTGNLMEQLKRKFQATAGAIEKVEQHPELVAQQPEDYGEAVLVEKLQSTAADEEIKTMLEALAVEVEEGQERSPELKTALKAMTEAINEKISTCKNPAKLAETIGINNQNISGGEVYQTFGPGGITVNKI